MRTPRGMRFAALTVVLAMTAAGCGDSSGSAGSAGGVLRLGIGSDPASLDPALTTTIQDAYVASPVYETLLRRDQSGKLQPGLAEKWTATPTTASLTLRSGIVCADGTQLTAQHAAASLQRLADPATKSTAARFSFGPGKLTATGGDATRELTVTLDQAWSDLLVGLSMPWTGIVCPAGLTDPAVLAKSSHGTGPYVLSEANPGRNYAFTRRNTAAAGEPSTLDFRVVPDQNTLINQLTTRDMDLALLADPDVTRLDGDTRFRVDQLAAGSTLLLFNQTPGKPTADPAVRRAIMQALDKRAFNQTTWAGKAELMTSLAPDSVSCVDKTSAASLPSFDAGAARAALAGRDVNLKIIGTTQVTGGAGTSYVQAALKEAGISATLANTDTATWAGSLFGGKNDWDITVLYAVNLTGTLASISSYFTGPAPPNGTNVPNLQAPAFSAAVATATTTVGAESCAAWASAQRAIFDGAGVMPLTSLLFQLVWSSTVSGSAPQGVIDAASLRIT